MPLPHQFLGEIGNNPFCSPIEVRGATLGERGNLCDLSSALLHPEFADDQRKY